MARILVADDSDSLLEIFEHVLKLKGHQVFTTDSRDTFFMKLCDALPDIIFMDVRFSFEDGRELCLIINEGPYKAIPVVLMSASPQLLEDYAKYGACAKLEKPFVIREILETMDLCLNGKVTA